MNLATARSTHRAREIGVRKAIGAERRSLMGQFMGESLLLVGIAFMLAIGIAVATLPALNSLTEKTVRIGSIQGSTLLLFAGIGLFTALIAGAYPALYLSSFDAVRILKGTFRPSGRSARQRKGLVVFQFAMSVLLITGTITVYKQIRYIHSVNLGLDRENVIYLPLEGAVRTQFVTVKEELLRRPGISAVTAANASPLDISNSTQAVSWAGKEPGSDIEFHVLSADFSFLDVMKMEVLAGRDFDPSYRTDSINYMINEQALRILGFENPVGEQLSFWGGSGSIIGVVKDFNMVSLYDEIKPTIIRLQPQHSSILFLRTEPGQTRDALVSLEEIHRRFNPGYPFEYQFLDEQFRQTYHNEAVIGKLAGYFTGFALFITCLGLLGLASFTAQQRTKEFGIRKVLGASVSDLAVLLSREFIVLVLIAIAIITPISYFLIGSWLTNSFAYRIEPGASIFIMAGGLALLLAIVTTSYQAIQTALKNPVKSLMSE